MGFIQFVAYNIRPAKKKDVPLILALLYELGRPKPQKDSELDSFRNLVKKQISDSDKEILVAESNDINVVGMASLIFLPRLNQLKKELYIPELIVTEKYQNLGIGRMLVNACMSLAVENGCDKIRLESGNQRTTTHKFYNSIGFESNSLSFTKKLD